MTVHNACPRCRAFLDFHAIASVRGIPMRVLECRYCGHFVWASMTGEPRRMTKEQPPKAALIGA